MMKAALVLMLLSLPCVAAAGETPSKPPTQASTGRIKKVPAVNGIPLALLSFAYVHTGESGVATVPPERYAELVFHPSGTVFLLVGAQISTERAFEGTFSYRGGALSLRFASREFARSGSFSLDLSADEVAMPFQVFSAEKGTSTWKRRGGEDRLLSNVADLCGAFVRARKTDVEATTQLLAEYLKPFAHAAGTPEVDVSPAPRIFSMTSFSLKEGAFRVELDDPNGLDHLSGSFAPCFHGGKW